MIKKLMALLTAALMLAVMIPMTASAETYPTPEGYNDNDYQKLVTFFETENEDGVKNGVLAFGDDYDPADPETWKGGFEDIDYRIEWTTVDGQLRVYRIGILYTGAYGVLDLSGCTALEVLYCSNNITELNLNGCTALEELGCASTSLTELDITNNTELRVLYCSVNNFTELDITKNSKLEELYCEFNNLSELDVTQNTELKWLYCGNNNLTELNVTKNSKLEWLNCESNDLTALDITKNTALTRLNCEGNDLTELDVTKNTALEWLNCEENDLTELDVSECAALEILNCFGNNLTELNVSGCTALEELHCTFNNLTELDVSGCTALIMFNCSGNKLSDIRTASYNFGENHLYVNGNGYVEADNYSRFNEDLSNDEDYGDYCELDVTAIPMEGNVFIGWYDSEGNLVSSEAEYVLEYGTDYTLEARFEGSEPAGTDKTPVMGPVLIIGIAAAVVVVAVIVILLIRMRKKAK